MPVFKIIAEEKTITFFEKEMEIEAETLEEALEIAKEEADNGYWDGWEQIGDPISRITVSENNYE